MGIATVAVCSDPDRDALFVRLADVDLATKGGSRLPDDLELEHLSVGDILLRPVDFGSKPP